MVTVILTIHTLIVLALIGVVLLQRSEGGALGMGGGGMGGFMTGRGAANVLTRTTSVLAALFFATSLALAIFAGGRETDQSVLDQLTGSQGRPATTPDGIPAPATTDDLLKSLGAEPDATNPAPDAATPPADAATSTETPAAAEDEEPAQETPPSENPGE